MAPKGESKLSWWGFVLFCPKEPKNGQKSPGKFCHWIFNPGNKWSQKSWNFLPSKEKNPGIFSKKNSWIPWKIGIPGIFWSQNFPSWNILSGNFLSWDFISRKILAFIEIPFYSFYHYDSRTYNRCHTNSNRVRARNYLGVWVIGKGMHVDCRAHHKNLQNNEKKLSVNQCFNEFFNFLFWGKSSKTQKIVISSG